MLLLSSNYPRQQYVFFSFQLLIFNFLCYFCTFFFVFKMFVLLSDFFILYSNNYDLFCENIQRILHFLLIAYSMLCMCFCWLIYLYFSFRLSLLFGISWGWIWLANGWLKSPCIVCVCFEVCCRFLFLFFLYSLFVHVDISFVHFCHIKAIVFWLNGNYFFLFNFPLLRQSMGDLFLWTYSMLAQLKLKKRNVKSLAKSFHCVKH